MNCKECGTSYRVEIGVKGRGCPNKRHHEKYVRIRVRKLIKEKGLGYIRKEIDKIPFSEPKRDWADEEYEKVVKKKRMDQDRMNGVMILCSYLPVKKGERYDIIPDSDFNYSLILNKINIGKEIAVVELCDADEFCKKILLYRDKVMPNG